MRFSTAAASAQAKSDDKKSESIAMDFGLDARSDLKKRNVSVRKERLTEIVQRHIPFSDPGIHMVIPRRQRRVLVRFRRVNQGAGISIGER